MLTEIKNNYSHFFVDEYQRRQGKYKTWWYNKQPEVVCYYLDGKIHGEYKQWHESGILLTHCVFANGKYHGEFKEWWESGKLHRHCFYVDGNQHSEYKSWHEDGTLRSHWFVIGGNPCQFSKIPYPTTPEDRMYFMLKYNLQLLPLEAKC